MTELRADGRTPDQARPLTFERDFTEMRWIGTGELCRTRVLCTASVQEEVPRWLRGTGKGWVTAEYSMLPGSTPDRAAREAAKGKQSGRTQEIQRLIGRSLRTVTRLEAMPRCQLPSTATSCKPTAVREPRRSAAATLRCTMH